MSQDMEKKLKKQLENELNKERKKFNEALEVKEQEIKNLRSANQSNDPSKYSSPDQKLYTT